MPTDTVTAAQAIQNAQTALQHGDKLSARRWAGMAASLEPEREDAWLLLAAVAIPQASVGYLKQALKVNPQSQRARAGMAWALKRLEASAQTATTARVKVVQQPISVPESTQKSGQTIFFILLSLALIALLVVSIWNASPVLAFFTSQMNAPAREHAPSWALVGLLKPTMTLSPTATPTATPTPTSTPEFTATPAATQTPIPSPTLLPTDTAVPGAYNSSAPAAVSYLGGKWILVDISEQHLWAYDGDTLVYSFVASTGMGNSTRVGSFHVQDKIPNAYGANWNIWMPNWLGIYYSGSLENGIHALPILSNGQRLWAGYLGTPISFGCVVLGVDESLWLYDWAEVGIPVVIQR